LHFGLWSLAGAERQFGGVGAMVDAPALALSVRSHQGLAADGVGAARAVEFARRFAVFHRIAPPDCKITIEESIPEHAGLGSGTQLGLAVAAALSAYVGLPSQSPQELALSVNRGLRSAVGTYGFVFGGLIVEQGKLPGEPISPLDCRIDLPEDWRFVLARPQEQTGLAGEAEAAAFAALAQFPREVTEQLVALVRERLVPGAAIGDFRLFAESLYEYGRLSGECFAARQGGPYNGPVITALIGRIRELGGVGVGQSSWGPTVYVVMESQLAAQELISTLTLPGSSRLPLASSDLDVLIAQPCNQGAVVTVREA
jgi:beta-ribofuranosylaminobenzene 5'-phosphate synthase